MPSLRPNFARPTGHQPPDAGRWLALFSALALLSASPFGPGVPPVAAQELPDLGDASYNLLPEAEEQRLGRAFHREAKAQLSFSDDPFANRLIAHLAERLARAAGIGPVQTFLVEDPGFNAFAVPGGRIYVHTGLLTHTQHEDELAAILAHEIAHLSQRHIARTLADQQRMTGPTLATLVAAVLLAGAGESDGAQAAVALSTAAGAQRRLNFSRVFEQEADRIGLKLLDQAGLDAQAMPRALDRMMSASRLHEGSLPEYLRTHPLDTRRVAEATGLASRLARPAPDHAGHNRDRDLRHCQVRLSPHAGTAEDRVRRLRKQLVEAEQTGRAGPAQDTPSLRYGLAIALHDAHRDEEAHTETVRLLTTDPDYVPYQLLAAEIRLARGQTADALARMRAIADRDPASAWVEWRYADMLLADRQSAEAVLRLRKATQRHPGHAGLHKLLSQASEAQGDKVASRRALAEYHALNDNPKEALNQLELALKAVTGGYLQAGIEARKAEIEEILRQARVASE